MHDPSDTTTAQGRLSFNLFASLAEFERELIQERTQAGLSAARDRGRNGGRPKGIPPKAKATACPVETLYKEGRLKVTYHFFCADYVFSGMKTDGAWLSIPTAMKNMSQVHSITGRSMGHQRKHSRLQQSTSKTSEFSP
ncbi:recombinase family protein [Methylicorpusculum oleiharenae]|nr:recombinase family protein [Methylicorpusculum oleiharenae]MCD2448837.1 recombinase family protein [Methylicorpusculum oleiharenae]